MGLYSDKVKNVKQFLIWSIDESKNIEPAIKELKLDRN